MCKYLRQLETDQKSFPNPQVSAKYGILPEIPILTVISAFVGMFDFEGGSSDEVVVAVMMKNFRISTCWRYL